MRHRRGALFASLAAGALMLAAALAVIFSGLDSPRAADDQNVYHLRAIQRFSDTWGAWDFSDYESATTPGYHLVLAAVHRFITTDLNSLRATASLFAVALTALVAFAVSRRLQSVHTGWRRLALTLCLILPLVCSLYVFSSAAWLLPDDAAWLFVTLAVLLALRPRVDAATYILGGLFVLAAVLMRQVHLWTASLVWLAAFLGSTHLPTPEHARAWTGLDHHGLPRRLRRALLALLVTLPAFAVLAYFVSVWGGLTPRMFQADVALARRAADPDSPAYPVTGGNLATPAFLLTVVGAVSFFYTGYLLPVVKRLLRGGLIESSVIALAAAAGLVLGLIPESTYNVDAGRYSGLWGLVRRLPTVMDRSPVIALGCSWGCAMLALWFVGLTGRARWVFAGAWAGFIAAQSTSALAWQRYYEPFAIIMFSIFAAELVAHNASAAPHPARPAASPAPAAGLGRRAWVGIVALSLALAAVTAASLR